ncbi:MAG: nucleotidyltransferase domain-containing protein [Candidatus Bathyarchaeia archaeon]
MTEPYFIKPVRSWDDVHVRYSESRWRLLKNLRAEALSIISALRKWDVEAYAHGSVARGDVEPWSDVDVVVREVVPSHKIELALKNEGFKIFSRKIAQATPRHAPKAHIYLDLREKIVVTFPLASFRAIELDFYKFGGIVSHEGLIEGVRVPGCTKRLTVVRPVEDGHIEFGVVGREVEASKVLDVNLETVLERERVLLRRDKIGRTGIFISKVLEDDETFEKALKSFVESNPMLRRFYDKREG